MLCFFSDGVNDMRRLTHTWQYKSAKKKLNVDDKGELRMQVEVSNSLNDEHEIFSPII